MPLSKICRALLSVHRLKLYGGIFIQQQLKGGNGSCSSRVLLWPRKYQGGPKNEREQWRRQVFILLSRCRYRCSCCVIVGPKVRPRDSRVACAHSVRQPGLSFKQSFREPESG